MKGASKSQPRYGPGTGGLGRPRDERIDTEVVSAVLCYEGEGTAQ
jgi:hypothetical protein